MKRTPFFSFGLSLAAVFMLALSGCAPQVGGNQYTAGGAQQSYAVEFGTVHSVRQVQINDDNSRATVGAVGGAALGGVVGNMFGDGKGRTLATIGGALAGAAAGGAAGHAIGNQVGLEVTVSLDNGKTIAVVQGADLAFTPGQRVRITQGGDGTTHVSPL